MKRICALLWAVAGLLAAQGPAARMTVGIEQSAAGSAAPAQNLALQFTFTEPVSQRLAAWGDLRQSSLPKDARSTAATLAADTAVAAATTPLGELVRAGDFLAGASYRVAGGTGSWSKSLDTRGAGRF